MTLQIALLLGYILIAMILFAIEVISAEIVALGLLLAMIFAGMLTAEDAFAGFGSETALMILGLLILTAALVRTGVVDVVGHAILRRTGNNPKRLLLVMMISAAALSAFISNTAATAFFVPIAMGLSRQSRTPPSRLLMPLAFASILTSPVTVISSSTNIVISGLIRRYDMPPLRMFEMSVVGIVIAIFGIAYMYWVGRRIIPTRENTRDLLENVEPPPYSAEIIVLEGSPLIGRSMGELELDQIIEDVSILRLQKGRRLYTSPRSSLVIEAGDILTVQGRRDDIVRVKDQVGIDFKPAPAPGGDGEGSVLEFDATMVEAILLPGSPLIGRTPKRLEFAERYGLQILGIHRSGKTISDKFSRVRLRVGDQLLLQGDPGNIAMLGRSRFFRILGSMTERTNTQRAPLAVGIFILSLGLATFGVLPLAVAVLLGALLAFVTRCLTPEEAYREVEWKAFLLIGSMLALGTAMEQTGTATYIADLIVSIAGGVNPLVILGAFFVLSLLLTQPMSNQAAAVVVVPIAIQTALQLDLNPRTFAIMIAIGASCSFLTPLEPSCLMVYGPGNYRFVDFVRVGSLLTLIILVVAIVLVPLIWPLSG